jgi:tRNA threonylcarbamoyladenosine biosynthesis protein TsaE
MADHIIPAATGFSLQRVTSSPAATNRLGAKAARLLQGGESLLVHGVLGAGKTCFIQGICQGLGVQTDVVSPTFNLVNRYSGRLVVYHLDFYRLGLEDDLTDIGLSEILDEVADQAAVLLAEWPERLAPLLPVRQEWLAQLGSNESERIWHLRGIPQLANCWHDLFAAEEDLC